MIDDDDFGWGEPDVGPGLDYGGSYTGYGDFLGIDEFDYPGANPFAAANWGEGYRVNPLSNVLETKGYHMGLMRGLLADANPSQRDSLLKALKEKYKELSFPKAKESFWDKVWGAVVGTPIGLLTPQPASTLMSLGFLTHGLRQNQAKTLAGQISTTRAAERELSNDLRGAGYSQEEIDQIMGTYDFSPNPVSLENYFNDYEQAFTPSNIMSRDLTEELMGPGLSNYFSWY